MSGEDNISECSKKRSVLGDITNRVAKRAFSSISGNSTLKSVDGGGEIGGKFNFPDDGNSAKRVCVPPGTCNEISSLKGNAISGIAKIRNGNKDSNLLDSDSCTAVSWSAVVDNNGANNTSRGAVEVFNDKDSIPRSNAKVVDDMDWRLAGMSVPTASGTQYHNAGPSYGSTEDRISSEGTESDTEGFTDGPDDQGGDNLFMSQSESIDFTRLPESQESRVELDKCIGTKTCENSSDLSASIESIKSCSCSFCTQAAYIWLDLHYQDIKGRIAAIKKSQKEASILVERSRMSKGVQKQGPEKYQTAPNLESSLMGQWRSLFQHMGRIFESESDQLEGSLQALTNLKERCKEELESFNGKASENC